MKKVLTAALVLVFFIGAEANEKMAKVTKEIENINKIRESLVGAVAGEVTKDTFTAVCKPVGQQLKNFAKKNGVKVNQPAMKFRNPKHKPNEIESRALAKLENEPKLISFWQEAEKGRYYFRRIPIKKACLNCHGAKATRPVFIKKGYPKDKAFDFKIGDLRGAYSVFLPN